MGINYINYAVSLIRHLAPLLRCTRKDSLIPRKTLRFDYFHFDFDLGFYASQEKLAFRLGERYALDT